MEFAVEKRGKYEAVAMKESSRQKTIAEKGT